MAKRKDANNRSAVDERFLRGDTARPDSKDQRRAQEFENERLRREREAAIQAALAAKKCRGCTITGNWKRYNSDDAGRVIYVRCTACGHTDKIVVDPARPGDEP